MPNRFAALSLLRLATLIAGLLTLPSYSTAQAPATVAYDVELVIFRNLGGGSSGEQWSMNATVPGPDADGEAPDPTAAEAPFPKVPPERLKLSAIYDTLKRNRAYQPLAHIGWTQPAADRGSTHYVSLNALGMDDGLVGRAALARGRYLHLTLDLTLQIPGDDTRYVLKQTRRMRSTEMHYIDHPRFGVVALITPAAG
jgi:hypothetical protein